MGPLEIVYQDSYFVAINKPHNLLVHRTSISEEKEFFALQILRDQLNQPVFPCHRIDRKTAGVLLFAFTREAASTVMRLFEQQQTEKEYLTLVRGFTPESGEIDKSLAKENGKLQAAFTAYHRLDSFEIPIEVSRYPTSRYSLVKVLPKTGRMHQIRRHFAHIRHYVIGDKVHGECKHNKMFEQKLGLETMLLHARQLVFYHPFSQEKVTIQATLNKEFQIILDTLRSLSILS